MQNTIKITEDLYYIGCSDRKISLFENVYPVPNGISYNSYFLDDEKTVLFDTVDKSCSGQFFDNLNAVLNGRNLDYLIINHLEPDHSALIKDVVDKHPQVKIVCNAKTKQMLNQFFAFANDIEQNIELIQEGSILNTGKHEFTFVMAPMVHWPEVMVTYDTATKALFSADGFGTFGVPESILSDADTNHTWAKEARRYYIGIVGKYGPQVQMLLKKLSTLDVKTICPLHGPVLTQDLGYYIDLYKTWSAYEAEEDGVVIAYASIYGNTASCAQKLCDLLTANGYKNIILYDLARADLSRVVADAFRYSKLVLASATYNADLFPPMQHFINALKERNYQNRTVAFIENGTWAPTAAKLMKERMSTCKNLTFCETTVTVKSKMQESDVEMLERLAKELMK